MASPLVVVIAPSLCNDSVAAVAWRHAIELSRSHRVTVISRDAPQDHPAIERMLVAPRSWNVLRRFAHVPNELAFVLEARRALEALASRERVALVWCHSHSSAALAAAPLKRRFGFRIAMTTHGDIFDRPQGTYSRELTWFYRSVTPAAYARSDRVHALSDYMGRRAVAAGANPTAVRIIPNGIEPADLGLDSAPPEREAPQYLRGGALHLLYVGSLWKVKGPDVLLRAVARCVADGRTHVQLTVVGSGPETARLQSLARDLSIARYVRFMGHLPRTELRHVYERADALCIPSRSEAFPLVALEAMLCGLPVIGSDTGGIPSLVESGATGWLVVPDDPAALAQAICEAAEAAGRLARFGAAGRAKVLSQFTWQAISRSLNALADELVTGMAADSSYAKTA